MKLVRYKVVLDLHVLESDEEGWHKLMGNPESPDAWDWTDLLHLATEEHVTVTECRMKRKNEK